MFWARPKLLLKGHLPITLCYSHLFLSGTAGTGCSLVTTVRPKPQNVGKPLLSRAPFTKTIICDEARFCAIGLTSMTFKGALGFPTIRWAGLAAIAGASAALLFKGCNKNSESTGSGSAKVRVGYIGLTCEA